jgi:hypothetical protein
LVLGTEEERGPQDDRAREMTEHGFLTRRLGTRILTSRMLGA